MNRRGLLVGAVLGSLAFLVAPAMADLNNGQVFENPNEVLPGPDYYTDGLPAWYVGAPVASMLAPISGIGVPFVGTPPTAGALSQVYFVNGVDSTGGLGFVYQFSLDATSPGTRMVRASFAPAMWNSHIIFDTGSDNSGTTTARAGSSSWTDGDPYFIERLSTGAPAVQWSGVLGGTQINKGQISALIWFETDATRYTIDTVTLLDGGSTGIANVFVPGIPSPGAAVLGLIGSAMIGLRRRKAQV